MQDLFNKSLEGVESVFNLSRSTVFDYVMDGASAIGHAQDEGGENEAAQEVAELFPEEPRPIPTPMAQRTARTDHNGFEYPDSVRGEISLMVGEDELIQNGWQVDAPHGLCYSRRGEPYLLDPRCNGIHRLVFVTDQALYDAEQLEQNDDTVEAKEEQVSSLLVDIKNERESLVDIKVERLSLSPTIPPKEEVQQQSKSSSSHCRNPESDVKNVKDDIRNVKEEVGTVKKEVGNVQQLLQQQQGSVHKEMESVKRDVSDKIDQVMTQQSGKVDQALHTQSVKMQEAFDAQAQRDAQYVHGIDSLREQVFSIGNTVQVLGDSVQKLVNGAVNTALAKVTESTNNKNESHISNSSVRSVRSVSSVRDRNDPNGGDGGGDGSSPSHGSGRRNGGSSHGGSHGNNGSNGSGGGNPDGDASPGGSGDPGDGGGPDGNRDESIYDFSADPKNMNAYNHLGNAPPEFIQPDGKTKGKSVEAKTAKGLETLESNLSNHEAFILATHVCNHANYITTKEFIKIVEDNAAQLAYRRAQYDEIPDLKDQKLTLGMLNGKRIHVSTVNYLQRLSGHIAAKIPQWVKLELEAEKFWLKLNGYQNLLGLYYASFVKFGINDASKLSALNDCIAFGPVKDFEKDGQMTYGALASWYSLLQDCLKGRLGKSKQVQYMFGADLNLTKVAEGLVKAKSAYLEIGIPRDSYQDQVVAAFAPLDKLKIGITADDIKKAYEALKLAWSKIPPNLRSGKTHIVNLADGNLQNGAPKGKGKGKGANLCPEITKARIGKACREFFVTGKCSKEKCPYSHDDKFKKKAKECPRGGECHSATCWYHHSGRVNPFSFFKPE